MATKTSADRLRSLPKTGYMIFADSGAVYEVLEYDDSGDATTGYAISRHGPLLRFVQTGYADSRNTDMKRCRITVARDPGYADDTVIFDGECEHFGGLMPNGIAVPASGPRFRQRLAAVDDLARIGAMYA